MLLSISTSLSGRPDLIGVSIAKHRPEHVDASAGERDERLVMACLPAACGRKRRD